MLDLSEYVKEFYVEIRSQHYRHYASKHITCMWNSMESGEQIYFFWAINIMDSCLWLLRRIPYSRIQYDSTNLPPIDTLFPSYLNICNVHNIALLATCIPFFYCVSFIIVLNDRKFRPKTRVGPIYKCIVHMNFGIFPLGTRTNFHIFFLLSQHIMLQRFTRWCAYKAIQEMK